MFEVYAATTSQLNSINGAVGNDITIRPAGYSGIGGGGNPLPQAQANQLSSLPHVKSVQESVNTIYSGNELVSAIISPPGAVARINGVIVNGGTPPIMVIGIDPSDTSPALTSGGTITMVTGRYFTTEDAEADVVLVGQTTATKNNLGAGSEITIGTDQVEVIGIFTTGQQLGDNTLIFPIETAQRLYAIDGVTSITVSVDSVKNVNAVVTEIRAIWDTNIADIVTAQQEYSQINGSLTNANGASRTGMLISFVVAGVVVLASVVLVVRQRVKEIGIMKAIGASNWQIGFQFSLETVAISIIAAIFGVFISVLFGQQVANSLVGPVIVNGNGIGGIVGGTIGGIHVAVSPDVILIAFGTAVILAIIASMIPVWYIARVRPADVLRNE
jgi:putative ABC transport system permease protein